MNMTALAFAPCYYFPVNRNQGMIQRRKSIMNTWMNTTAAGMATLLSEDVGAPELRNPRVSAMRRRGGWLRRVLRKGR